MSEHVDVMNGAGAVVKFNPTVVKKPKNGEPKFTDGFLSGTCCCHIKTGMGIWGILEVGMCVGSYLPLYVILQHWNFPSYAADGTIPWQQIFYCTTLIFTTLQVIIVGVMEYGLAVDNYRFLIPHLIQQIVRLLIVSGAYVYSEVYSAFVDPDIAGYSTVRRCMGLTIIAVLGLASMTSARCLLYLRLREHSLQSRQSSSGGISYQSSNIATPSNFHHDHDRQQQGTPQQHSAVLSQSQSQHQQHQHSAVQIRSRSQSPHQDSALIVQSQYQQRQHAATLSPIIVSAKESKSQKMLKTHSTTSQKMLKTSHSSSFSSSSSSS